MTSLSTGTVDPAYLAAGDFNGDGRPDLVVSDPFGRTVSVYLNQGDGTFSAPVVTTLNITNAVGTLIVGDINEDGKQDLIVATHPQPEAAVPLLSNGDGTFSQQPGIPNSSGFLSGKLADFNADGHLDLFLGGNGQTYFFLGKGDGTFTGQAIQPGTYPGDYLAAAVGDLNGDKLLDAIGANTGFTPSDPNATPGSLDIFLGQAGGGFRSANVVSASAAVNPQAIDLADFDRDGKLDILVADGSDGNVFIGRGNGDGTFQLDADHLIPIYTSPIGNSTNAIHVDLDQDGRADVVALDYSAGILTLALNDASAGFSNAAHSPYVFQLPANSYRLVSADFNGDGLPDIAVANSPGKLVSLLFSMRVVSAPSITLTSSGDSLLAGSTVLLQINVSGSGKVPTGSVTLADGSDTLSTKLLDGSGSASFSTNTLSVGDHALQANYSGDAAYSPVSSPVIRQSVTDFQIGLNQSTATVAAGSNATYAVTLTPIAGFSGTVGLNCTGLPALAQCNAATVNLASGLTVINVVVTTTAATSAQGLPTHNPVYYCALLGVCSVWFVWGRRRMSWAAPTAVLVLFLGTLTGCGGASKKVIAGTPSGSTSFTITATGAQNGTTATHSANATLVIQ